MAPWGLCARGKQDKWSLSSSGLQTTMVVLLTLLEVIILILLIFECYTTCIFVCCRDNRSYPLSSLLELCASPQSPASCSEWPILSTLFLPSCCKRALCIAGSRGPAQPLRLAQQQTPHLSDHLRVVFHFGSIISDWWLSKLHRKFRSLSAGSGWCSLLLTNDFPSEVQGQDDLDCRL